MQSTSCLIYATCIILNLLEVLVMFHMYGYAYIAVTGRKQTVHFNIKFCHIQNLNMVRHSLYGGYNICNMA